jgi:hypothetical protein
LKWIGPDLAASLLYMFLRSPDDELLAEASEAWAGSGPPSSIPSSLDDDEWADLYSFLLPDDDE